MSKHAPTVCPPGFKIRRARPLGASQTHSTCGGFTLLEVAISMAVIGILLTGMLGPLAIQVEQRRRDVSQQVLSDALDALLGYAVVHGVLPCADGPDAADGWADWAGDGQSDAFGCKTYPSVGWLPHRSLGVRGVDGWGNRLGYAVSADFTRAHMRGEPCGGEDFDLCATPEVVIEDLDSLQGVRVGETAFGVAAVVVGFEKNAREMPMFGGSHTPGQPPAGDYLDEPENADGDLVFVSRRASLGGHPCSDRRDAGSLPRCQFDDLLVWVSPAILMERMVSSRRLP